MWRLERGKEDVGGEGGKREREKNRGKTGSVRKPRQNKEGL